VAKASPPWRVPAAVDFLWPWALTAASFIERWTLGCLPVRSLARRRVRRFCPLVTSHSSLLLSALIQGFLGSHAIAFSA
jgi:hypothetical protein